MMKLVKLAIVAVSLAAVSAPAHATSWWGGGDKTYNQGGHGYGGKGGHGGSASSDASAKATGGNTTIDNSNDSAFAPGFGVDGCATSMSVGVVGAAAGLGIPSRKCNIVKEAVVIQKMGGDGMSHLCLINRVKRSQGYRCGGGVTDQTYRGGKAGTVSTRNVTRTSFTNAPNGGGKER